jgi:hypothetical protein
LLGALNTHEPQATCSLFARFGGLLGPSEPSDVWCRALGDLKSAVIGAYQRCFVHFFAQSFQVSFKPVGFPRLVLLTMRHWQGQQLLGSSKFGAVIVASLQDF